ncbi:MAG: chromosome partitioning protein ParB, partial [Planctomycetota bacterium]|nr:chromosome partitioning protein ParB [Planctomycetota bacterium]
PQIKALEQQLRRALGTTVEIKATRRGKGKIMVHFNNNDEFIRIRDFLTQDSEVHDLRRAG